MLSPALSPRSLVTDLGLYYQLDLKVTNRNTSVTFIQSLDDDLFHNSELRRWKIEEQGTDGVYAIDKLEMIICSSSLF
jgi:hypothetical protein